jgi:hypothetical protein
MKYHNHLPCHVPESSAPRKTTSAAGNRDTSKRSTGNETQESLLAQVPQQPVQAQPALEIRSESRYGACVAHFLLRSKPETWYSQAGMS